MSITFNSRIESSRNLYALSTVYSSVLREMERLSSGLTINRAADNPAGLVISEQLRSQIGTLNRELDNVESSINKYMSVSSTVSSLRTDLNELRDLALGASNSANEPATQTAFATAAGSLVSTYNRTIENDEYNNARTLDGSENSLANAPNLIGIDLSTPEAAVASITLIDDASAKLDQVQMSLGARQKNELQSERASLQVQRENLVAAESQLRDADMAQEYTRFVGSLLQTQAAMAMLSHNSISALTVAKLFS